MNAEKALAATKPFWLRLVGWLSVVLLAVVVSIPLVEMVSRYRIPHTVWPGFCLLGFFPLSFVWLLGTIIYRVQRQGARLLAAQMLKAAREHEAEKERGKA